MPNQLVIFLATVMVFLTLPGQISAEENAGNNGRFKAGTHYQVLDIPVRTSNPQQVEATEVFWYGCSHCYSFEPTISAWEKALPEDVVFVRSPAIWHPSMELHARAYYTAKILGVLGVMHKIIFEEINLKQNKLASKEAIAELFTAHSEVSPKKFYKVFDSFGVNSAVRQAEARQRGYQIQGTPEMIVNGRYRVTGQMGGSRDGMIEIVNHLIKLERKALIARAEAR
jgi:thiol:disulfide interchange protein DsbA